MLSLKEAVGKRLMVNEHTNLPLDMNEGANLCRFNAEINYRCAEARELRKIQEAGRRWFRLKAKVCSSNCQFG